MLTILLTAAFVGALGLAAVSDVRSRRIPNLLTVSALVLALVLRAALGGGALLAGLAGVGIAMLVMLPLFALRGVGGGDAKLMMVVGAFLGPKGFLLALLATAVAGGAMSLIAAARAGVLLPVLYNTGDLAKNLATLGRKGERVTLASPGAVSVPYGVAIALGSLTALFLGGGI